MNYAEELRKIQSAIDKVYTELRDEFAGTPEYFLVFSLVDRAYDRIDDARVTLDEIEDA